MRNLPAIQTTEQLYYENILRYHESHMNRYRFAMKYMNEKSRVLDYGCGSGYGSFVMSGEAGEVFAVDADKTAINYAKDFYARKSITHLLLDHPPSDWSFDVIVALEVVEHVDDADGLMAKFRSILKQNGVLIMSVPNEDMVPLADACEHNHKYHKQHFTNVQLDELIERSGLHCEGRFMQYKKFLPNIVAGWGGYTNIAVARKK